MYPRPRALRRDQPAFKVKSVLNGTEYEGRFINSIVHFVLITSSGSVSRQELVGFLQQQIVEQKRIDKTTAGASVLSENLHGLLPSKDTQDTPDVQLLLPTDAKKQRKQTKQLFLDRGKFGLCNTHQIDLTL